MGRPALDIRSGDDRHSTVLSECQVAQCCPEGLTIIEGGDGSDVLLGGSNPECLVGLDGDDALHAGSDGDVLLGGDGADLLRGGSANDVIAGGPGPDDIDAGSGDDEIRGGAGADVIDAGSGNDIVDAGSGDDTITGGSRHDIIVPGPGLDTVIAGGGDDTVIVYDPCELEPGESYAGGSGFDTLVLPVPLHEVEALGVTVMGFEQVIVDPKPELSACNGCSCTLQGGALDCCSGEGTCDLEGDEGLVVCDCAPGLAGSDCSYDPATTFFDDPPPVGCTFDDPGCWVTFDADDELIKLDPDLIPLCADLPEWLKFEEVSILAHYPTLDGQPDTWAPGTFPVTVLGTGNFISVAAYQGLATHLARSGGTIVLVVSPTTNQGFVSSRGEMAHCIRRLVEASELELLGEPIFDHWDGRFAHGGHSRGGEAAVVANALDHDFALAPADAVFGLAPTGHCAPEAGFGPCGYPAGDEEKADPDSPFNRSRFEDGEAKGFLVLEGSRDADNTGEGIALFDIAAREQLSPIPSNATVKAMQWAFDVPHRHWTGAGTTRGALLGKSYVTAFIDWWLRDRSDRRPFFTGEALPPCVQDPASCDYGFATPELFPQFREGGPDLDGRREIVRYFVLPLDQEEGSGPAHIQGQGQHIPFSDLDASPLFPRAKLRGSSVALVATPGSPSTLRLALDGFGASTPVDAVDLRLAHLSLRVHLGARGTYQTPPVQTEEAITQACEDFAAQNAQDLRLRVTLYDASAGSETVFSDAYRRVAPTDIGTIVEGFSVACEAVGFWTTVRIPLQAFEPGVNLRELTTLELTVRSADHANLETGVLVDSVELVGHALDAVCGDGEAQGDESCDGADLGGETCPSLGFLGGGTLACTEHCTFDTAACIPGGGGEPCPEGDPGCPGGPCLLDPGDEPQLQTFPGVAAYHVSGPDLLGPLCNSPLFICREDAQGDFLCHDCEDAQDSGYGCPCGAPGFTETCDNYPGMGCVGAVEVNADPAQYPIRPLPGACFPEGEAAPGYCLENCAAQDRVCGKLRDWTIETICITNECGLPPCEEGPAETPVCDRDSGMCIPACIGDASCPQGSLCTTWGECWVE